MTHQLFAAPRPTGRVHLSSDGQYALCGWRIRADWVAVPSWNGYVCQMCRQVAARHKMTTQLQQCKEVAPASQEEPTPTALLQEASAPTA